MLGCVRHWLSLSAAAALVAAMAFPAAAQDRVRWKMQSAFGSQLPHLGPSALRFTEDIKRMSGGRFAAGRHAVAAWITGRTSASIARARSASAHTTSSSGM
jgi:TRAP-type mannitol/chloroaromatic compound transport system substrate-binding protein